MTGSSFGFVDAVLFDLFVLLGYLVAEGFEAADEVDVADLS